MKVKTADLIDAQLDYAVAKAQGREEIRVFGRTRPSDRGWIEVRFNPDPRAATSRFDPSDNWSQGGPIIEWEWIELQNGSNLHPDLWGACKWSDTDAGTPLWEGRGPTPLIAACRCFVASRLGDEVDIPEELLK